MAIAANKAENPALTLKQFEDISENLQHIIEAGNAFITVYANNRENIVDRLKEAYDGQLTVITDQIGNDDTTGFRHKKKLYQDALNEKRSAEQVLEMALKLKEYAKTWKAIILPNIKSLSLTEENLKTVRAAYTHLLHMRTVCEALPKKLQDNFATTITSINKDLWQQRLNITISKLQDSIDREKPSTRADGNPELPQSQEGSLKYVKPKENAQLYEKGHGDNHKIDPNDLQQGVINNCFALAPIAAIAKANPNVIEQIIKQKSDGSFEVTLHLRKDPTSKERTKTVIPVTREFIESTIELQNGSIGKGDFGELWTKVLDKAIAQAFGGYDALDHKGYPDEILQAIAGKTVTREKIVTKTKEELFVLFEKAVQGKKAVVIGSLPSPDGKSNATNQADDQYLVYSHSYYLDRVSKNKIWLKNPAGNNHLKLSWKTFMIFFDEYSIIN